MKTNHIRLGAFFAMTAVIAGAFGAHALKRFLEPAQLDTFEIGVRYQFYHALALILTGLLRGHLPEKKLHTIGYLFMAGIILFSGSLYLLATQKIIGMNLAWLGPITPIGGSLFIVGWALLVFEKQK